VRPPLIFVAPCVFGLALGMGVLWSLALLPTVAAWLHYSAVKNEEMCLAQTVPNSSHS
jgi:hypothetical protein